MSDANKQTAAILAAARLHSIGRGVAIEAWVDEYEKMLTELNRRDEEAGEKKTAELLETMRRLNE